jgi:hypothetical protein
LISSSSAAFSPSETPFDTDLCMTVMMMTNSKWRD